MAFQLKQSIKFGDGTQISHGAYYEDIEDMPEELQKECGSLRGRQLFNIVPSRPKPVVKKSFPDLEELSEEEEEKALLKIQKDEDDAQTKAKDEAKAKADAVAKAAFEKAAAEDKVKADADADLIAATPPESKQVKPEPEKKTPEAVEPVKAETPQKLKRK